MTTRTDVGVIVGRWQCAEPHDGQKDLINYVLGQNHNLTIIVLGKSLLGTATKRHPLDVDSRIRMLQDYVYDLKFGFERKVSFAVIEDIPGDNAEWSAKLDKIIAELAGNRAAVLYGSRDSFLWAYEGKFSTHEYKPLQLYQTSATEDRAECGKRVVGNKWWREGVIWATQNQFDAVYPCVDVAIFEGELIPPNFDNLYIWLGQKSKTYQQQYLFIGGFADPGDTSYEYTAKREVKEEAGLDITNLSYVTSMQIDDYRYRAEINKIISILYLGQVCGGTPEAHDDITGLVRVKWNDLSMDHIAPPHQSFYKALADKLQRYKMKELG